MELSADINFIAVVVAAASNMIIGMLWYSQLMLGKMWMKLSGMTALSKKEAEEMKKSSTPAMFVSTITSLLTAYVMAHFVSFLSLQTTAEGAQLGFWLWLGFTGASGLSDHMFTKNPLQLFVLNTGYRLIALVVMGAVLVILS